MKYVKHYITIAGEIITPEDERVEDYLDALNNFLDNQMVGWVPEDWVVLNHGSAPATIEEARRATVVPEEESMGDTSIEGIEILTKEEAVVLFDQQARKFLGMSGEEFLRRYDAGEFSPGCQNLDVSRMIMLLPLARRSHEANQH